MRFLPVLLVSFTALTSAIISTSTVNSTTNIDFQDLINGIQKCNLDCYDIVIQLSVCVSKGKAGENSSAGSDLEDSSDKETKNMFKCICEKDDDFFDKFSACATNCPVFAEVITDDEKEAKKIKQFYCKGATATSELAKTSSSLNALKTTTASATGTSEAQSNSTSNSTETKKNSAEVFGVSLISLLAIALL